MSWPFQLTGLGLGTLLPLGIAGALGIVILYILRLRRRGVTVPYIFIWERLLMERKASTWRSKLRRYLSLFLHLLLLLLLLLALGDPRSKDERSEGRTMAVLIDVSASMGAPAATDAEPAATLLDVARDRVRGWLAGLAAGDRLLLVEMGAQPQPVSSWTNDRARLEEGLESLAVLDTQADFEEALRLAIDALRDQPSPELIVVSDGRFRVPEGLTLPEGLDLRFERVVPDSKETENVGISAFSGRRYPLDPSRYEVLVEVFNGGREPAEVELRLLAAPGSESSLAAETAPKTPSETAPKTPSDDGAAQAGQARSFEGTLVELERFILAAGERKKLTLRQLSQLEEGLVARVERVDGGQDRLPADDVARALLEPLPELRVLVVGKSSTFLDAALLLDPSLAVERIDAAAYPPAEPYQVTVFDGVYPERAASTGAALYLGVPDGEDAAEHYPVEPGSELRLFGFDRWDEDSSLFRFFDPYDIQVLEGRVLRGQPDDRVLGYSQTSPILIAGQREAGRFLALGFAPEKSDFVLRAAWPLFVQNVLAELAPRSSGDAQLGRRTGELIRARVTGLDSGRIQVTGPLHSSESASFAAVVQGGEAKWFARQAGFFELGTEAATQRLATSLFDQGELEAPAIENLELDGTEAQVVEGFEPRRDRAPWFWLVAIVLAVSFVEWWTYHQRWTV